MSFNKQILREIIADQRQLGIPDYAISREMQAILRSFFPNDLIIILSGLRRYHSYCSSMEMAFK